MLFSTQEISRFKSKIQNYISENRVQLAIDSVINFMDSNNFDRKYFYEVLVISSINRELNRRVAHSLISYEMFLELRAHYLKQLLKIIDDGIISIKRK